MQSEKERKERVMEEVFFSTGHEFLVVDECAPTGG